MLADPVRLGSAEDYCSWRGSGLTWDSNSRAVEQVHLRCTEGFLEWMYPTRALRVILEPNLTNGKHTTICLKPCPNFKGANIYVEKGRVLQLLVSEASDMQQVHCFAMDNMQRVALFIQACPQEDIRRRTAGFQYELFNNQNSGPDLQKFALMDAICRPCDNAELLMAVCRSDFVVRGTIKNISHDQEAHTSHVDIRALNVYRQTNSIFQLDEATGEWTGRITTLLKCRVQKGEGDFLFTGNEHFGDAWLGCAPRFKDFLNIYQEAKHQRTNPCEFQFGFSLNIPAIV
ncbi:meteorin-like protein [Bombina bombina]|uniref:meteorin-like protein n=1 Tax=Bombina bombina TaxID=8345 RepID=UPI00235A6E74|nr:meteorin-like protein [Bombina bombina]XP_053577517.1 meteorin-like protein [Bombina bombina]